MSCIENQQLDDVKKGVLLQLLRQQLDRLLLSSVEKAADPAERDATVKALLALLRLEDTSGVR